MIDNGNDWLTNWLRESLDDDDNNNSAHPTVERFLDVGARSTTNLQEGK